MSCVTQQDPGTCACGPDCSPSKTITVTVKDCGGTLKSGASVTVTGPGGYSASCTTNGSGVCSVTWDTFGTYTVSATDGTYSNSTTVNATTCTNYTASFCLGANTVKVKVTITPPCGKSTGATYDIAELTVNVIQGGSTVASGGTSGGIYTACVPASVATTVHLTCTSPRFTMPADASIPATGACNTVSKSMTVTTASGYACACNGAGLPGCNYPISKTLTLTDSLLGITVTLSYDATLNGGAGGWLGTGTATYGGISGCSCVASGCGGVCSCPAKSVPVTYNLGGAGLCGVSMGYPPLASPGSCNFGNCPDSVTTGGSVPVSSGSYTISGCPESSGFAATSVYSDSGAVDNGGTGQYLWVSGCTRTGTTLTITE